MLEPPLTGSTALFGDFLMDSSTGDLDFERGTVFVRCGKFKGS
jgi:hypothetical protein